MNLLGRIVTLLTAATLHMAPAAKAQSGGPFDLSWSTLDSGGGASVGGNFSLNGTIGQPDAGAMSGGNYSLAGGFWGANQTPLLDGSVTLQVRVVGGEVRLRFNGIPGRTYEIERARFVTGPWRPNDQPLAVITMPSDGVVEFVDVIGFISPQSFYYRTRLR